MKYLVEVKGRTFEVVVDGDRVTLDGRAIAATLEPVPGSPVALLVLDGGRHTFALHQLGRGGWFLATGGQEFQAEVLDERTRYIRSLAGTGAGDSAGGVLKAPMPGLVVRIQAEPGQAVAAGTPLVVLEAMKMENQLKAPASGVVSEVRVGTGQAVEKGQVLVVVAAGEASP